MNVFSKIKFGLRKRNPEILTGVGIGAVVTGAIMACKATMKLSDILEEHNEAREFIKEAAEKDTEIDIRKETAKALGYTGFQVAKLYAPAVIVGSLGITALISSNRILCKRNAALAAAYAATEKAFSEYRKRVIERFGEEVDQQLISGATEIEVDEIEVDEKGKEKHVKKKKTVADPNAGSQYSRYLTRTNPHFNDDEDLMAYFFRCVEAQLNDNLHAKRWDRTNNYIVLNQAYEAMAFDTSKPGMISGWVDDPDDPSNVGVVIKWKKIPLPGPDGQYDDAYLVDFNCTDIYDKIM
jgi:hypothetical protein